MYNRYKFINKKINQGNNLINWYLDMMSFVSFCNFRITACTRLRDFVFLTTGGLSDPLEVDGVACRFFPFPP